MQEFNIVSVQQCTYTCRLRNRAYLNFVASLVTTNNLELITATNNSPNLSFAALIVWLND